MLNVVVYETFSVVYRIAFSVPRAVWLSLLVDLLFYVDIILNFNIAIEHGHRIITDRRRIAANYLKFFFWIDFFGTVDWTVLPFFSDGHSKLVPMIRMLRILNASKLVNKLTETWTIHSQFVEAMKFSYYIGMLIHVNGCFFYMVPELWSCPQDLEISVAVRECIENPLTEACSDRSVLDGRDWYHADKCLQGSWRQQHGLEIICLPHTIDANQTTAFILRCVDTVEHGLEPDDPGFAACPKCMSPYELYIDSIWWSVRVVDPYLCSPLCTCPLV